MMDKRELLNLRASILAGELRNLAQQAREEGNNEVYIQLKQAARELPADPGTYNNSLETVRSRLTPQVANAMRPRIEAEAEHRAAEQYQTRTEALDLREAGMDHQPKTRTPWIALGATLGVWGTIIVALLT